MKPFATPAAQRNRALFMLLIANFCWGLSFPVVKALGLLNETLLPGAGTWFATIYTLAPRFVLATLLLIGWNARGFWRVTPGECKQGVIIGLFAAAGLLLQNDGLQFTAASTSAFLTQLYAILIPIWVAARLRRNPGWVVWVCCALVLAGVAVLGRFDWHELRLGRGEWETLLCSIFFMGQILWLDKKEFVGNRPMQLTLVMFATLAVVFTALVLPFIPNPDAVWVPWTSFPWVGLMLTLVLICTVGAYCLMNVWQPKISATEAGLIYCIEPVFGSLLALFLPALFSAWAGIGYPNETATWTLLVGGGLITLANVLLQTRPSAKTQG